MGTPPAALQLRALLDGERPDPSTWRRIRGTINQRAMADSCDYVFTGDPEHLNPAPYFGRSGVVGDELFGYTATYAFALLGALYHARRSGHDEVAEALQDRSVDLLSALALFATGPWPRPIVPAGGRQGRGQAVFPTGIGAVVAMARSGREVNRPPGSGPGWWDHPQHLDAWVYREMLREGMAPPRVSGDLASLAERARRRAGIHVPVELVSCRDGWYAFLPSGISAYDNRHFAVASAGGRVRVLSPRTREEEEWRAGGDDGTVVEVPGREVRASCRVERERGTPRARLEDWSGSIDVSACGPELRRWRLEGASRRGWDFSGLGDEAGDTGAEEGDDDGDDDDGGVVRIRPGTLTARELDALPGPSRRAVIQAVAAVAASGESERIRSVWKRIQPTILANRERARDRST